MGDLRPIEIYNLFQNAWAEHLLSPNSPTNSATRCQALFWLGRAIRAREHIYDVNDRNKPQANQLIGLGVKTHDNWWNGRVRDPGGEEMQIFGRLQRLVVPEAKLAKNKAKYT
jgi:hypothetical protein